MKKHSNICERAKRNLIDKIIDIPAVRVTLIALFILSFLTFVHVLSGITY